MPLTDTAVKTAKPRDRRYKISDERGLYIEIAPNGGKWWRFKYRFGGKEKLLSLGVYPDVSLKQARERQDEARKLVADKVDPGEVRKAEKASQAEAGANTFEVVAREWLEKQSTRWSVRYFHDVVRRMERDIFPAIGKVPINDLSSSAVLKAVQRIKSRGALETARRQLQVCGQVFDYAVATDRAEKNPAIHLRGTLTPVKVSHHASITDPKAIGALLRAIEGYDGSLVTLYALRLAYLTFVRPGELRKAEWSEIDLEAKEWRIPAERMKMKVLHIVPLSRQAINTLEELQRITGRGRFLFPGARSNGRPMSENTVNAALRRLGYTKEEMTGHGFRSMASTILNEEQWNHDAIERQLAHSERNKVRAAYNYAEHLETRTKMMQWWADYLDGLKAG
ncbi:MAG: integrase [Deltaproteobacteria bacterium]|nr:MAG: integrase [Deltaproteobacteria bacterium]